MAIPPLAVKGSGATADSNANVSAVSIRTKSRQRSRPLRLERFAPSTATGSKRELPIDSSVVLPDDLVQIFAAAHAVAFRPRVPPPQRRCVTCCSSWRTEGARCRDLDGASATLDRASRLLAEAPREANASGPACAQITSSGSLCGYVPHPLLPLPVRVAAPDHPFRRQKTNRGHLCPC